MILQLDRPGDLLPVYQRAVGRLQVLEQVVGVAYFDRRVVTRRFRVVKIEVGARSPDGDSWFLDAIYAPRVSTVDDCE